MITTVGAILATVIASVPTAVIPAAAATAIITIGNDLANLADFLADFFEFADLLCVSNLVGNLSRFSLIFISDLTHRLGHLVCLGHRADDLRLFDAFRLVNTIDLIGGRLEAPRARSGHHARQSGPGDPYAADAQAPATLLAHLVTGCLAMSCASCIVWGAAEAARASITPSRPSNSSNRTSSSPSGRRS